MRSYELMRRCIYLLLTAFFLFPVISCDFSFKDEDDTGNAATWKDAKPLKGIYANDFMMGNIISSSDFDNAARFGILKRHYNIITAENEMKPNYLAPAQNPGSGAWNYRFSTADTIVNKALEAGFKVHGHTLIWHSQSPSWLAAGGENNLNKFVGDVATHFKGRVISWDVVNEAFRDGLNVNDAEDWTKCLREDSPWFKSIGHTYIEKAFTAARDADPNAKLYYNDYNLNSPAKSQAVHNMVKEINKTNKGGRPLIDGIGMQSHHHLNTSPQSVETAVKLFASLNVEIGITEMDIIANNGGNINVQGLGSSYNSSAAQKQAALYAAMFRIFKDNSRDITRVTFWGIDDGTSWRKSNHPTLLTGNYRLKPAFYAVLNPKKY